MRRLAAIALVIVTFTLVATPTTAQEAPSANRLSPEMLWKLGRVGGGTASGDGTMVAYTVRTYELSENKGQSSLNVLNREDNSIRTVLEGWKSIGEVQWATVAGKEQLAFIGVPADDDEDEEEDGEDESDEGDGEEDFDDSPQAYSVNPETGDLVRITSVEDGIANLKVSPTGKHIAFTRDIKMDKEITEIYEDLPEANVRLIDSLLYRHWNAWHDFKYSHLHVATLNADGQAAEAKDLMDGIRADCPVPPFGGSEQFNWSPDGTEIAYTLKDVPNWAESTNSDVFVVNVTDGSAPRNISQGMNGYDNEPVYSPDGTYLAFHSMERPSFESDRNRVMVLNRRSGEIRDLTANLDQTAHGSVWAPDSKSVYFVSEHRGTNQIFRVSVDSQGAQKISDGRFNWEVLEILPDGKSALVSQTSMLRPRELGVMQLSDGSADIVTNVNGEIYADLELPTIEERWVEATDGKQIHCWVIYPPGFDKNANQKWPLLTYFQGGPQGQIGQWFSYRWNFHLMAANGYVVVAPNRRGLPGFGREWNDQISGDWGGQAMQDLLSATDSMLAEPYIDKDRVGGIGASFGGYTAYWMMGNHGGRFSTFISHCGVFNLESMYGATEELFFVNWDLGGPYWKSDELQRGYNRFSPHRFVGNWDTPLLVIHGEKDFRVPVTQGMEAFTAAQVRGIPSKFLYFPTEGHWVLGPQNSVVWHRVFFEWLDEYCKNPGK